MCEDELQSRECRADRRSLAIEMLGSEYDTSSFKSTHRRHKALAIAQLKLIAGPDNFSRQQQLAQALVEHYRAGGVDSAQPGSEDYVAHSAVIEGIVQILDIDYAVNIRRYVQ